MKLSNNGLQKIVKREGVILHAYRDTVGVWTIGTGHTSAAGSPKVIPGMVITKEENDHILSQDLRPIVDALNKVIKVPVTQNQFDALVSIAFNVGPRFYKSTCIKRLNQKDYDGAAEAILMWNTPSEIQGRRRTEYNQFKSPGTKMPTGSGAVGATIGGATAAHYAPSHWGPYIIAAAIILGVGYEIYRAIKNSKVIPNVNPK